MDVDAATADAVAHLHAAVLTPTDWPAAISRLSALFDSDHAICMEGGRIGDAAPAHALAVGIDADAFATLLSPRASALAEPWNRRIPHGRAISSADFMTDSEVMNTDMYQEFIKPVGGFHAMTLVRNEPVASFQLTLCRSRRGGAFERAETERLQRLVPQLSVVFELRRRLAAASAMTRDLRAVVGQCRDAVILVDAAGRPVITNARADAILAAKDGLRIDAEGLRGVSATCTYRLRAALGFALRGTGEVDRHTVCLPRASGRLPLLARLVPLPHATAALQDVPASRMAIFLTDPEAPVPVDLAILCDVFGLTRREAELAGSVSTGKPLVQVASGLGMGLGTARQHLKHIYGKTGTHDRAGLVALIRSCAGG